MSKNIQNRLVLNGKVLLLPENYDDNDRIYFEPHLNYNLLKPYIKTIRLGILLKSGTVLNWRLRPVKESLPWSLWASNYKITFWIGSILKALLSFNIKCKVGKVAIVFNNFSNNYFHWITEVLPKMYYLYYVDNKTVFLLPENYNQDYQLSTLKILGANFAFFKEDIIFFKKVTLFSGFSEYPGYYEPKTLLPVRSLLIKNYLTSEVACDFVYVSRRKAARRKVLNEDEIQVILLNHNFKIFYLEELSFSQIVQLFRKAKVLISIHGAALTNMIFMEKGSIVFELMKEKVVVDKCYFFLANTLEMKYYYQTCKSKNEDESHVFADIYADAELFEKNIELIMSTVK